METEQFYGRLSLTNGWIIIGLPLTFVGFVVAFVLSPVSLMSDKPLIIFCFVFLMGINLIISLILMALIFFRIYRLELNSEGFQEHGILRSRLIQWEDCNIFRNEGAGGVSCIFHNGKKYTLSLLHGLSSQTLIAKLNAYREQALAAMERG